MRHHLLQTNLRFVLGIIRCSNGLFDLPNIGLLPFYFPLVLLQSLKDFLQLPSGLFDLSLNTIHICLLEPQSLAGLFHLQLPLRQMGGGLRFGFALLLQLLLEYADAFLRVLLQKLAGT